MQTHLVLESVRNEVKARGVQPVARELGVARTTLASVLGGVSRPGTALLVATRWAERPLGRRAVSP